ncbi:hypothetical protein Y032_0221g2572 [Ancylostoma ceylanicum]|uniref:Uncharacterized protein n=1 Tax=Ancylostoma ceylanicum TaxID=53326 RepID=A0A016SJ69_9BILA|nr:hypothetical protein Y032_0221g2572 [Ancylostoma ceylanicum]
MFMRPSWKILRKWLHASDARRTHASTRTFARLNRSPKLFLASGITPGRQFQEWTELARLFRAMSLHWFNFSGFAWGSDERISDCE